MTISQQFEDDKGQAAEFLAQQVQQLYQENRSLVDQNCQLSEHCSELQQVNAATRCELEKYTQWAREAGTDDLLNRLETLQDMLYQVKESTDVTLWLTAPSRFKR